MADVSVIIVTWNSEDEITACLDSIYTNKPPDLNIEIIVVDNYSSDRTCEVLNEKNYGGLQLVRNKENRGYTGAVNQGISMSQGKNLLLLNPDTVLNPGTIEKLSEFLDENEDYGACAPLLLNRDGSIQHSIRNFPSYWNMYCEFTLLSYIFPYSKLFGSWKMKYFDYTQDADVNQPMTAVLMIKRSLLNETGVMDERFEMFFNDVDLCRRITGSGKKIRFLHGPKVIHKKGASIYKDRVRMIRIWSRDCTKYFEKHHGNFLLLIWLKISLKISENIRILYFKLFK